MARHDYAQEPIEASLARRLQFSLIETPLNTLRVNGWMSRARNQFQHGEPIPDERLESPAANGHLGHQPASQAVSAGEVAEAQ